MHVTSLALKMPGGGRQRGEGRTPLLLFFNRGAGSFPQTFQSNTWGICPPDTPLEVSLSEQGDKMVDSQFPEFR